MKETELIALLDNFRNLPGETEWIDFKQAEKNFSFEKLGKYFSALSNEANLKGKSEGWLVFGIADKSREISDALNEKQKRYKINNLLNEMSNKEKTIKNSGSDRKPHWVLL